MMNRTEKLEAALREIISFANDYRHACIPEFVFLNRVLEITNGEALRALATPRTSEWNEAIKAAASVGTLYPSQRASIPLPQAQGAVMSETLRTDNAEYINIRFARELERDLMRAMKERDSAWNDAITEVIALVASGKGDDQALLRQRICALKRKEQ